MGWNLWTIVGVGLVPTAIVGAVVAWRDRRRTRGHNPYVGHQRGVGEGYAAAGMAEGARAAQSLGGGPGA